MRKIVNIKFGSHLYGTSTPASDLDFKSVYVPDAEDILLQRVKGSVSTKRLKAEREKNYAGEVDEESYSLQRYLGLVAEGQTVALDVLFAPEWAMAEPPSPEWQEIISNRHRLLTRKSAAFVGYCRTQSNKYGIKGSRVAASRAALNLLEDLIQGGTTLKLGQWENSVRSLANATEHMEVINIQLGNGSVVPHWEVCGRKMPFTASVKTARDIMAKLVADYGHRALQAESQQGVDWKALSHAVRVGMQAIELLHTGHITFPLPNAEHILQIKKGELLYQDVGAEIEELLVKVEEAAAKSALPDQPDHAWIDSFVADIYRREVSRGGLVERARIFATAAHAAVKQLRKYTNEPYINHPAAVAEIVAGVPHTPEMLAAAWLHDTVEDTGVTLSQIRAEFGPKVADLVFWLTDVSKPEDGNRDTRKAMDREHIARAPAEAQTVKVADLIDNTRTIEAHDPDFARVYRHEKERLLNVMDKADSLLTKIAREQISAMRG